MNTSNSYDCCICERTFAGGRYGYQDHEGKIHPICPTCWPLFEAEMDKFRKRPNEALKDS